MKPKVLIVGGTGYLGTSLVPVLSNMYDVHITGTKPLDIPRYFLLDFLDKTTFNKLQGNAFECVIILAASIAGIGKINLDHRDLDVNVWGYKQFLQYLVDQQITSRVVYFSSMTVYDVDNEVPVKEDGNIGATSIYGLTKSFGEQLTAFIGKNQGMKSVTLRIPGLFGGNRTNGFLYNTIKKCFAGEPVVLDSSGLTYWECIDVSDLSSLVYQFLKKYDWRETYNIFNMSYGEETDFISSAHRIKELTKSSSRIEERGTKGYVRFFLSNSKIRNIIPVKHTYQSALERYIESLAV